LESYRGKAEKAARELLTLVKLKARRHRPLDLLTTPAGTEIVETFLKRLEHGVYT
jgi:uncharacterized protein (DUF2384 family)